MDESARQFGIAERAKAIRQREEAQFIIDYWDRLLGNQAPAGAEEAEKGSETSGPGTGPAGLDAPAVSFVAEAEFVGTSTPKAIKTVMERMEKRTGTRRPLRVNEMYAVLSKGGIAPKNKDQMYTTLTRSPLFHSPVKGLWGLVEWYPASALRKGKADETEVTEARAESQDEGDRREPEGSDGQPAFTVVPGEGVAS